MASGLLLTGCVGYRARPLSQDAVNAALESPSLERIKVAASQLQQPVLAPIIIDGRDGFTPEEIAVITVIVSPRLRALRDQHGVAAAQAVQAGLLPNPQLGYSLDRPTNNSDPSLVNGTSLGLSWEITSLIGRRDRSRSAELTANALDLDIAWQEWQAAQAARLSAYRVISLEKRRTYALETEQDLFNALAQMRQAFDLRDKTSADLAAAAEAWSAAQDIRFGIEQELTTEKLALNLALNQPADAPLKLKSGLEPPDLSAEAIDRIRLLDGLEKRRLDLVALTLGYESSEASLRAAVKAQFPKISLSFARAKDTSDVKSHSFGVTIDLPLFDHNQSQIAAGEASRQQLFDEYVSRVAEARADVTRILSSLAILRTQLKTLGEELPELEKIVAALDRAMETRNADAQAWRDAHGAVLTRRTEQAKLSQDFLDLEVALELATGRPLLSSLANR
jgi:outer membrane protein TolC